MRSNSMNQLDQFTYLVTGGAGFIGSNICGHLLNNGCKVKCLDNLSTGKMDNISAYIGNNNFEFIEGDIRELETCLKACKNIDYILHQAAWGSVPRSIEMPILYQDINVKGFLNILEAARLSNVKKVVYASSSSVYGDSTISPKVEGVEGLVLSPYALTKKIDEEYASLYSRLYGLNTCGLRYFNVFGKHQDPNSNYSAVIPKFIKQILHFETPIIYGDGLQSRDFTYIDNVVNANLNACFSNEKSFGNVYNIANGENHSLIDVYNIICKILNSNIKPVYTNERSGDIKHSLANIDNARNDLNYSPAYSFEKGLEMTIDWYVNNF